MYFMRNGAKGGKVLTTGCSAGLAHMSSISTARRSQASGGRGGFAFFGCAPASHLRPG